jgi:hypothetical protein
MKIRLIKPVISPPKEKDKKPPDEVQIVHTIRSWVEEFKSSKADKARLDFRRIKQS